MHVHSPAIAVNYFGAHWGIDWKSENCAPVWAKRHLLWSECVMTDLDGATLGTLLCSMCSGTFLLISIGIRVPLGQSECIVIARSSK